MNYTIMSSFCKSYHVCLCVYLWLCVHYVYAHVCTMTWLNETFCFEGGARMKYPSQFLLVFYTCSTPPSLSNMDSSSFPDPQLLPQSWQDDLKGFEYQKTLQLVFSLICYLYMILSLACICIACVILWYICMCVYVYVYMYLYVCTCECIITCVYTKYEICNNVWELMCLYPTVTIVTVRQWQMQLIIHQSKIANTLDVCVHAYVFVCMHVCI